MFNVSFHDRVAKHLAIFHKTAEGLKQVQEDIRKEVAERIKTKQQLAVAIKDHESEIAALNIHNDQIGDTISKINALLPPKGNVS